MATYTSNYQLHQWAPEDDFLRTDFNEDFAKIDMGIAAAMAEAAVKSRAVSGSYSGNGSTRSVNLGFQPQAVLVENWRGTAVNAGMRGLGLWGNPLNPEAGSLTLTETGFTAGQNCCSSGVTYYYLAVK